MPVPCWAGNPPTDDLFCGGREDVTSEEDTCTCNRAAVVMTHCPLFYYHAEDGRMPLTEGIAAVLGWEDYLGIPVA